MNLVDVAFRAFINPRLTTMAIKFFIVNSPIQMVLCMKVEWKIVNIMDLVKLLIEMELLNRWFLCCQNSIISIVGDIMIH